MTVAEKIKRSTKPLTWDRVLLCGANRVKTHVLMSNWKTLSLRVTAVEYTFIDGSKLTCRVYW